MTDTPAVYEENDPLRAARQVTGTLRRKTRNGRLLGISQVFNAETSMDEEAATAAAVATAYALVDIAESLRVLAGRSSVQ